MNTAEPAAALTVLSSDECNTLLATQKFGRLGVVVGEHPMIIPVNFAMDRQVVVIRSRLGNTFEHACHSNVSFQVDRIDPVTHTGWSVLVLGLAEEVTAEHSADLIERTEATGVVPWAPGEDFRWLRIIPHGISGRRVSGALIDDWHLGTAAYM